MTARTGARRMGTLGEEEALLPLEEVPPTAVVGMATKEDKEVVMDMVATAADTIRPHRTVVTVEVVTTGEEVVVVVAAAAAAAVITLVEVINPVEAISPAEVTSPVDHTAPVSSPTGTKGDTTTEVEVVGEGTDHADAQTRKYMSLLIRFALSVFSSCLGSTLFSFDISTCNLEYILLPKHNP